VLKDCRSIVLAIKGWGLTRKRLGSIRSLTDLSG